MYIVSNKIRAFPLSKPRSAYSNDLTSRIFYEQNVSNLLRQLIDVDGFIISGNVNSEGTIVEKLCFNIYGYYFEIDENVSLIHNSFENDKIYVSIKIDETSSPSEIQGQDVNGEYTGLLISDELGAGYKGFQILQKNTDTGNWEIVQDSFIKFDLSKFGIKWIDGKR